MDRTLEMIESELNDLQLDYIDEEDEARGMKIVSQFTRLLREASELDGVDRLAAGMTITNWTRELTSEEEE